jgi:hypothetical protein
MPAFGALRRNGKVYTQIMPDRSGMYLSIIKGKMNLDSVVKDDSFKFWVFSHLVGESLVDFKSKVS